MLISLCIPMININYKTSKSINKFKQVKSVTLKNKKHNL